MNHKWIDDAEKIQETLAIVLDSFSGKGIQVLLTQRNPLKDVFPDLRTNFERVIHLDSTPVDWRVGRGLD